MSDQVPGRKIFSPTHLRRTIYAARRLYLPEKRTLYTTLPSYRSSKPPSGQKRHKHSSKAMVGLLVAAHNEELVLENTLRSAIAAGMKPEHIYVVDDNSADATSAIARSILPRQNVCKVRRSGKGLALTKAAKKFALTNKYRWIHIADADGAFAPDYFAVLRKSLRSKYAAATGSIRSLPGKRVSEYRVYEYTVGIELHRRFQAMLGVIPIIPGPSSCFRSDVFKQLNFHSKVLTEDFDVTLQIYRNNLGKIQFIPGAVAYTQDPLTTSAYLKQITRWNRGVMQGMVRHGIGKKATRLDAYLLHQVIQGLMLFVNCFVWIPYVTMHTGGGAFLAVFFLFDVWLTFVIATLVALKSKRADVLSAFPIIYAFKWLSLGVFIKAFIEVVILRRYRTHNGLWENGQGRRYQLNPAT